MKYKGKWKMVRVKRSSLLTIIFVVFIVLLVASATIAYFYAKKNNVGRVNITLVYGTYNDDDGFESEEPSENTIHTTVKAVRIGTIATLNYHDFDRMGHSIEGWYLDEEFENRYNSGSTIKEDITLYAKWQLNSYTIRFYSSPNGETTVNYLEETVKTYIYNSVVQVKKDGSYVNGFNNPFVGNRKDYEIKNFHYFDGWNAKILTAEEPIYDKSYYETDSFKMPAQDLNFVVDWEKFQAKVLLEGGKLTEAGENNNLAIAGNSDNGVNYYVKNGNTLLFNEGDEIIASTLETGFENRLISDIEDYNGYPQKMTFNRIGWKTNDEKSSIFGTNEVNYKVNLADGELVEETENNKIIARYYKIVLNANWEKEQVTLNFHTGIKRNGNDVINDAFVDSFAIIDITNLSGVTSSKGNLQLIGWAIPSNYVGSITEGIKYVNYAGFNESDANYFIKSENVNKDYIIVTETGQVDIDDKMYRNDSMCLRTSGRIWSDDLSSSNDSALTINLFAIWGYKVVYNDITTKETITSYVPTQLDASGNFTAKTELLGIDLFKKENSTLLGWADTQTGSSLIEEKVLSFSGKTSLSPETLYSVWMIGNGSQKAPFEIASVYDWNRIFKYLSTYDSEGKFYIDENNYKVFITEKVNVVYRYDTEDTGSEYIVINSNCYIKQIKDFTVSQSDPLQTYQGIFAGNYDGQGHKIQYSKVAYNPLFSFSGVADDEYNLEKIGKISNLTVNADSSSSYASTSAMIAHTSYNTEVINSSFNVNLYKQPASGSTIRGVGGLFGKAYEKTTFDGCTVNGTIKVEFVESGINKQIGGYVGYGEAKFINSTSGVNINLTENTEVYGQTVNVGGFIGKSQHNQLEIDKNLKTIFENCTTKNSSISINLTQSYINAGGFIGLGNVELVGENTNGMSINNKHSINSNWHNNKPKENTKENKIYAGGIIGYATLLTYDESNIKLINNGAITSTNEAIQSNTNSLHKNRFKAYIGGIAGFIRLVEDSKFINIVNNAELKSTSKLTGSTSFDDDSRTNIGGIVGYIESKSYTTDLGTYYYDVEFNNITNNGDIKTTDYKVNQGGLVGYIDSGVKNYTTLNNVSNNGKLEAIMFGSAYSSSNSSTNMLNLGGLIGVVDTNTRINYDGIVPSANYTSVNNGQLIVSSYNSKNKVNYVKIGGAIGCNSTDGTINISSKTSSISTEVLIHNFTNNGYILDELELCRDNEITIGGILGAGGKVSITNTINKGKIEVKDIKNVDTFKLIIGGIVGVISATKELDENSQPIGISNIKGVVNSGAIEVVGTVKNWSASISGIVGIHNSELNITNTQNIDGKIEISSTTTSANTGSINMAGIVGLSNALLNINKEGNYIADVINTQNISIKFDKDTNNFAIGGIVGQSTNILNVNHSINSAKMTTSILNANGSSGVRTSAIGGVIGKIYVSDTSLQAYKNYISEINACENRNNNETNMPIYLETIKTNDAIISLGGILGYTYNCIVDVVDCKNFNTIETSRSVKTGLYVGGIVGKMDYGRISSTNTEVEKVNSGVISLKTSNTGNYNNPIYAGGIVGYTNNVILENVSSEEIIVGSETYYNSKSNIIGGLIGHLYTKEFPAIETDAQIIKDLSVTNLINNCKTAPIKLTGDMPAYVGGAIGFAYGEVSKNNEILNLQIKNISSDHDKSIDVNIKKLAGSSFDNLLVFAGGIIGRLNLMIQTFIGDETNLNSTITNNLDINITGNFNGKNQSNIGGIIGHVDNSRYSYINNGLYLNNCFNTGDICVSGDVSKIGGLIGYTTDANIVNCQNTGSIKDYCNDNVSGKSEIGGLVGMAIGKVEIHLSRFGTIQKTNILETISKNSNIGGIIGNVGGDAIIEDCYVSIGSFKGGKASVTSLSLGGVVGYYTNKNYNQLDINYVYVNSSYLKDNENVVADSSIGGIIGRITNAVSIDVVDNNTFNLTNLQFTSSFAVRDIGNVENKSGFEGAKFDASPLNLSNFANNIWSSYDIKLDDSKLTDNKVTITFKNMDNNIYAVQESTVRQDISISMLLSSTQTQDGYKEFIGWSEVQNGTVNDVKYIYGDILYLTKNITLYPVFVTSEQNNINYAPGTINSPYVINTVEDWNNVLVPNAYTKTDKAENVKHFKLGKDLTLNENAIAVTKFNGVLDGNGKTLTLGENLSASPIPFVEMNGTIQNLNIFANNVKTYSYNTGSNVRDYASSLVVYLNGGMIKSCNASGEMYVYANADYIGSLVAYAYSGYIEDCTSDITMNLVSIKSDSTMFGGLVGAAGYIRNSQGENRGELYTNIEYSPVQPLISSEINHFALVIENSSYVDNRVYTEGMNNYGIKVKYLKDDLSEGGNVPKYQGGLLGYSTQNVLFHNIVTTESFMNFNRNYAYTGGLMGYISEGIAHFENCEYVNDDIVISGGSFYANFLGASSQGYTQQNFINCINTANITLGCSGGAIIGKGSGARLYNVISTGTVSTSKQVGNIGGLVGYIIDGGISIEESSWNTGTSINQITATNFGGFAGQINGASPNGLFGIESDRFYRKPKVTNSNVTAIICGKITRLGGFAGYVPSASGLEVYNSYTNVNFNNLKDQNGNLVTNYTVNYLGGFIGETTGATITNSYTENIFSDVILIGTSPSVGGLVGKSNGGTITSCNVLDDKNIISVINSENPAYIGGFVGSTFTNKFTISSSKFNVSLSVPTNSRLGGVVGYSSLSNIDVSNTIVDLKQSTVTEYFGGIIGYFNNRESSASYDKAFKVTNNHIAIGNSINSSNGKNGLIAGYMQKPTYITVSYDKDGNRIETTNYCYSISGNSIYYNDSARVFGNADITNNSTMSEYKNL